MPQTIQDRLREQRNDRDAKKGTAADATMRTEEKRAEDDEKLRKLAAEKKASATGMPKQNAGESPGAYSGRLRAWREAQRAAQEEALK